MVRAGLFVLLRTTAQTLRAVGQPELGSVVRRDGTARALTGRWG